MSLKRVLVQSFFSLGTTVNLAQVNNGQLYEWPLGENLYLTRTTLFWWMCNNPSKYRTMLWREVAQFTCLKLTALPLTAGVLAWVTRGTENLLLHTPDGTEAIVLTRHPVNDWGGAQIGDRKREDCCQLSLFCFSSNPVWPWYTWGEWGQHLMMYNVLVIVFKKIVTCKFCMCKTSLVSISIHTCIHIH